MSISLYWRNQGKTEADRRQSGRTFLRGNGSLGCAECCTKMITQVECDCYHRDSCPFCLGTGEGTAPETAPVEERKVPECPTVS